MVNGKVKIFNDSWHSSLEDEVNEFLSTIDIRQVVNIKYSTGDNSHSCMILYLEKADLRDIKIDTVLS